MRHLNRSAALPCLAFAALAAGCKGGDRCGVAGTVSWKGQPVKAGTILFLRPGSPGPAAGAAIKDGAFEVPASHGLPPGSYKVSVSAAEALSRPIPATADNPGDPAPFRETIPAKYNASTELTFDVVAGGPRLVLDLK
jgi:hypothetical protein